jgi:hypothetical protein
MQASATLFRLNLIVNPPEMIYASLERTSRPLAAHGVNLQQAFSRGQRKRPIVTMAAVGLLQFPNL